MSADRSSFPVELGYTLPTIIGSVTGNTAHDRYRAVRAVRAVAAQARDAAECADLLAMLGLNAHEGLHGSHEP